MLNAIKQNKTLLLLALSSIALYLSFGYDLIRSDFIKLISLYNALFFLAYKIIQVTKGQFWLLAGIGILFRLLFIGVLPNLSQDFYRFLWDGRLLIQGINPYLISPEIYMQTNPEIVPQAQELYNGMGALNASHFSNYPPVNQLFFGIAALFSRESILGSVIALRLIMILADIGILYLGKKLLEKLNLNPFHIFWYFINPFVIIELTGNLHFEALLLLFLLWGIYVLHIGRWFWAAILIGISISVKLIPLLLLPVFYNYFVKDGLFSKEFWKLSKFYLVILVTILVSFGPFLSITFIENFAATIGLWFQNFEFNASIYYIIRWIGFQVVGWNIIGTVGKILPIIIILFILGLAFFRKNNSTKKLITAMLFAVSFYLLLSTTVHPWYVATPLLLSVFTKYRFPIVWSFLVILSYAAYGKEEFNENLILVFIEYSIVIGYAIWEIAIKKETKTIAETS